MKIIVLRNSRDVARGNRPDVVIGADSALLRTAEPVFLPATDTHMRAMIAPAIRIGRLGLHIPPEAAAQYIDAHTLFHLLLPPQDDFDMNLWGLSDRTFSPGSWLPGSFSNPDLTGSIEVSDLYGNQEVFLKDDFQLVVAPALCPPVVAALSQYSTMKTGDVIVLADLAYPPFPITANTAIKAWLDSTIVLNFRIK